MTMFQAATGEAKKLKAIENKFFLKSAAPEIRANVKEIGRENGATIFSW